MKNSKNRAAFWLLISASAGLILSLGVFLFYAWGKTEAGISPVECSLAWHLPAPEYRQFFQISPESLWMFSRPMSGYQAATAALSLLASAAFPMLVVLGISWLRRGDYLYALMSLGIIGVLLAAVLS